MIYEIYCDKCGAVLEIEADTLIEAEEKAVYIKCCTKTKRRKNNG